jgi:hypothetical protein
MATALLSISRPHVRSLPCVRPLIPLRGSLLLAAHAYHGPPTGAPQTHKMFTPSCPHVSSLLAMPTSSLPHPPACAPLSCETFRREPATRQFVWSFAPMPMSCHRVEHQNGSGRPPAFPRGSASTGIVHCLSGPTTPTPRSPAAPSKNCSPRRRGGLLGPCFNTGPSPRATPLYFHFSPPNGAFSHFPRGTSSLSASPMYLAFDAPTADSHCTTKQPYSFPT